MPSCDVVSDELATAGKPSKTSESEPIESKHEQEEIDDDLDEKGILFVKVNEASAAIEYGIEERPTLVTFERGIPNVYEGSNFNDAQHILEWIAGDVLGEDTVEKVTDSMLDMMIAKHQHVAACFYFKGDVESIKTLGIKWKYVLVQYLYGIISLKWFLC